MDKDFFKRHLFDEVRCHHDHSCYPKENDIKTRHEDICRMIPL